VHHGVVLGLTMLLAATAVPVVAINGAAPMAATVPATSGRPAGGPTMAAEVARRHALTAAAPAVERAARSALGPAYAGLAIQPVPGGPLALVVHTSAEVPGPALRQIRAAAAPLPEAAVRIAPAERSLGELRSLHRAVRDRLVAAERIAIGDASAGSALDVVANEVVVWAVADAEPVRRALGPLARHPAVRVEGFAGAAGDGVRKDEPLPFGLVIAGQRLDLPGGDCLRLLLIGCERTGTCTSGFAVRSPSYGPFLLTAGHCAAVGDVASQGGAAIGPVALSHRGGRFDAALVQNRHRTQRGRVHIHSQAFFEPVHFAIARGGDPVGAVVCHAGFATNGLDGNANPSRRCGVIRSRTYAPPDRLCPSEPCRPVYRLVSYGHRGGDSGAPVYWETIYGRGAVGIHKGSGPDGLGVYSHLPFVLRAYGLRLTRP
jgi:hypothetical protein